MIPQLIVSLKSYCVYCFLCLLLCYERKVKPRHQNCQQTCLLFYSFKTISLIVLIETLLSNHYHSSKQKTNGQDCSLRHLPWTLNIFNIECILLTVFQFTTLIHALRKSLPCYLVNWRMFFYVTRYYVLFGNKKSFSFSSNCLYSFIVVLNWSII